MRADKGRKLFSHVGHVRNDFGFAWLLHVRSLLRSAVREGVKRKV